MIDGMYGQWPAGLVGVPRLALQFSPLVPGGQALEALTPATLSSMVMHAPPGTVERRYAMAQALQAMPPRAPLTVLARKDKGGRRIAQELRQFGCLVDEVARAHFRICTTVRPVVLTEVDEALEAGGLQQLADGHWSQPGVFSWERLDAGSALLLQHLPRSQGHGADLGAGVGLLAQAVLKQSSVQKLTLIEIDRRALAAAKHNVTDSRAQFLWADVRAALPELAGLDFVVMNPPFHEAGVEDKSLGQAFVTRAAQMLRSGGVCVLTANRHLPYEEVLAKAFSRTALLAEADGYKIYASVK